MPPHPFKMDFDALAAHYSKLVRKHGDSAEGAQYIDRATQEKRFAVLCEVGDVRQARILDFGCGTGQLLAYLKRERDFTGEYTGYDLSEGALAVARKRFPDARFECRDILANPPTDDFDYVFVSGVFNNKVRDNWALFQALARMLYDRARIAFAFNVLSLYVYYLDSDLAYFEPEKVFAFCKENLSPCVTLRHDYEVKEGALPYEFAVYVYVSPHPVRSLYRERPA